MLLGLKTVCCLRVVASSILRAESGDDPDPQHQCGGPGPVRPLTHRPKLSENRGQEKKRQVQEADRRNFGGNALVSH